MLQKANRNKTFKIRFIKITTTSINLIPTLSFGGGFSRPLIINKECAET